MRLVRFPLFLHGENSKTTTPHTTSMSLEVLTTIDKPADAAAVRITVSWRLGVGFGKVIVKWCAGNCRHYQALDRVCRRENREALCYAVGAIPAWRPGAFQSDCVEKVFVVKLDRYSHH